MTIELPEGQKQIPLAGDSGLPAAQTVVSLNAYGVAKRLSEKSRHPFSIDRTHLAARLRLLANLLEQGELLALKVSFISEAEIEDYTTTTMSFKFAEKIQVNGNGDHLMVPK